MPKRTILTIDQADELESAIGDFLSPDQHGFGNPKRDIQDLLRQVGTPKEVVGSLFLHLQSVLEDVKYLEGELTRGNAETVVEACKHLDMYMGKRFNVKMPRKNSEYKWAVWS